MSVIVDLPNSKNIEIRAKVKAVLVQNVTITGVGLPVGEGFKFDAHGNGEEVTILNTSVIRGRLFGAKVEVSTIGGASKFKDPDRKEDPFSVTITIHTDDVGPDGHSDGNFLDCTVTFHWTK